MDGDLHLPLTYNGEKENWPLLLSYYRYFDKSFTEMFLSSPLPDVSFLSKPLNLIG